MLGVVWFVGLNPEPNACRKRGTKLFTVVINRSLLSSPCSAVPTHRSRCARGLLGFRLRTVGSPGQRGGATDGGHGSRIAAAFTLRSSRRRQDPAVSRVGLGAAAYTLRFFPGFHLASASRWCKCRTLTTIGVDGVRTVERERARRTVDASRTRGERGFGGGGSCGRWRMTSTALG